MFRIRLVPSGFRPLLLVALAMFTLALGSACKSSTGCDYNEETNTCS